MVNASDPRCQPSIDGCLSAEDREALDAVFIAHIRKENASLKTRIEELESNERAYETALGERTYNEVAAHIASLQSDNEQLRKALVDSSFTIEALRAQLHSWGHEPSVNASGQIDRNAALLAKGILGVARAKNDPA